MPAFPLMRADAIKKYRVIMFGTGFVGHFSLRAIIEHPELELVGVWVHSPEKIGMDAGDIAGTRRAGIIATNSIDELLALKADCVCSGAGGNDREAWITDVHCRFLEAGLDIVSASIVGMGHPPSYPKRDLMKRIEDAAIRGKATFVTSGLDPGFSSDFALNLASVSQYWRSIRVQEITDYSTYLPRETEHLLGAILGFGRPMDYQPLMFTPGRLFDVWGGPSVTLMANALGLKLDDVREIFWRHPADETFDVPGYGTIKKGTQEAYRFEVQGIVEGRPAIVFEHITRMRKGSARQWTEGEFGEGYYVQIDGDPAIRSYVCFTGPRGDYQYGAILATAAKLVNAIPAVCKAPPGAISMPMDLPVITGRGLYRPDTPYRSN